MSFQNAKIVGVGVNPEEYHVQKGERGTLGFDVSSSSLRMFNECPSKFIHGFQVAPSASLEYGSLFDTIVLTPEQFATRYAVQPLTYETTGMECPNCKSVTDSKKCSACKCERSEIKVTKDWSGQSKTCREWIETQEKSGKEICSAADLAEAQAAAKRLFDDPILGDFIRESDKQVWIAAEWRDEPTGLTVPVKCLVDLLPRKDSEFFENVGDLKSTKCAKSQAWQRFADFAGYAIQGAWNLDLVREALPDESRSKFCFVLSESHAPWEPSREIMECDEMSGEGGLMANARAKYRRIMANYCQCLKHNRWPGFADTDEASDGWNVWREEPWQAMRDMMGPRYNFGGENEEARMESEPEPAEGIYRH